jgi:hypothetical protein
MVSARSLNVGGRSLAGNPGPVRMSRITNKLRTSQGGSRWFSAIFPALASSFAAPPKISVSRVWNQKAMAGRLNSMTPDQPPRTAATEPTAQPAIPLWLTGARVATAPALKGLPRRRKSLSRWQRPCGRVDCAFLDHFWRITMKIELRPIGHGWTWVVREGNVASVPGKQFPSPQAALRDARSGPEAGDDDEPPPLVA